MSSLQILLRYSLGGGAYMAAVLEVVMVSLHCRFQSHPDLALCWVQGYLETATP